MIKMSAICEEETNTISFLRIMATLGVLLVHVNGKIPLPGIIGSIAGYGADWSKMLLHGKKGSLQKTIGERD